MEGGDVLSITLTPSYLGVCWLSRRLRSVQGQDSILFRKMFLCYEAEN